MIVVPDKTLVYQWSEELSSYTNLVLKCFSDNSSWQDELRNTIDIFELYKKRHQYIIVTNDTFYGERFQKQFKKLEYYMLIVDECHTWGTDRILNNLPNGKLKLGLSATPELFFLKKKHKKLLDFFGGITHEYSLEDAIQEKNL